MLPIDGAAEALLHDADLAVAVEGGKLKIELAPPALVGVSKISPGSSGTSAALSAMRVLPLSVARSLTSERLAGDMMGASSFSIPAPLNGLFSMSNIDLVGGAAEDDDEVDWPPPAAARGGGGCGLCIDG